MSIVQQPIFHDQICLKITHDDDLCWLHTACFNGYLNLTHYYVMRAVCEHDNDEIKNDEKEILLDTFDDDFLIFTRGNITNFTVT